MIRSAFSPIYPYITNDSHVRIIASFHQVFRPTLPFTGIVHHRSGPTVCTSVSLRVSIRVSPPTLPLHWNNSPPIGVQHMCSCPSLAQPRQVHFRGNQLSFPVFHFAAALSRYCDLLRSRVIAGILVAAPFRPVRLLVARTCA